MFDFNKLIGMTEQEAEVEIIKNSHTSRVMSKNGEYYMGTADSQLNRVNLIIENDKVVRFYLG